MNKQYWEEVKDVLLSGVVIAAAMALYWLVTIGG
jgi:hypothetical protein